MTEVGVIPEDWDITQLGKLGAFTKGSGVRKNEANSGEIPCVRYGELYTRHNDIIRDFYSFLSNEVAGSAKRLKKGDILFAGSGETKAEIGKSAAFLSEIEAYAGGDIVILSPKKSSSQYLGYLLNFPVIQKQKASKGQGDAVVHISAAQLASIQIPLPPSLDEQTAIATALSDMDALIAQTEKLIEKKKEIRQGVMQRLLSPVDAEGKVKVGWYKTTVGKVAPLQRGFDLPNRSLRSGDYPVVYSNGVLHHHHIFQVKGPGIVTGRSGTIGKVNFLEGDFWPHNTTLWVTAFNDSYPKFIYYLFGHINLERFATGSGVPTLNRNDVHEFEIIIPRYDEQKEIATTLSFLDKELSLMEFKLNKHTSQKQAMMQALLTGRIRLVKPTP